MNASLAEYPRDAGAQLKLIYYHRHRLVYCPLTEELTLNVKRFFNSASHLHSSLSDSDEDYAIIFEISHEIRAEDHSAQAAVVKVFLSALIVRKLLDAPAAFSPRREPLLTQTNNYLAEHWQPKY